MTKVFRVEISGAFGLNIVRIGQMGEQCRSHNLFKTLYALGMSFQREGVKLDVASGMAALEAGPGGRPRVLRRLKQGRLAPDPRRDPPPLPPVRPHVQEYAPGAPRNRRRLAPRLRRHATLFRRLAGAGLAPLSPRSGPRTLLFTCRRRSWDVPGHRRVVSRARRCRPTPASGGLRLHRRPCRARGWPRGLVVPWVLFDWGRS